ncbi:MAG: uroporphyrinogen-III synthase [Gemmatimonadales bacterium]
MSVLAEKRVVVTRAVEQADELGARLEAAGAVVVRCPTIVIAPAASHEEMDAALGRLGAYDWLVVTSANGVRFLFDRAATLGLGPALAAVRVAAVGRVTANALAARGATAAFTPDEESAEALGRSLPDLEGRSVLLVQGAKSDPALARMLAERGAAVTSLAAYRTIPVAPSGEYLMELRKGADALTFTSPSTVEGFVALGPEWRSLARRAVVATIGPTTTTAALSLGLGVHAEARERSMAALVEALESVWGR